MKNFYVTLTTCILLCAISYSQTLFEDEADILGLTDHTGTIGNGSGISFADYNGDGWDDITLPSADGIPLRFYKNFGGFFVEEFILPQPINYRIRSVTWVDYDNDGDRDLFISSDTSNGNKLFRKNSGTILEDVTLSAGLPLDNLFTYGVSWGDYDNDGCLDLYLSNRDANTTIINYLFKNNCDGTFSDVTTASGLVTTPALTLCAGFFDFNNDGWQDLYVSNDKSYPNFLYKNNGDGTFSDISDSSGTGIIVDAMSVSIDDYDSDGFFDIYITNTPSTAGTTTTDGSVLFKNNGDETFTNVAPSIGAELNSWSWGASFLDAENDGDLDLYVSCSYISTDGFPSYGFYENDNNGSFVSSTSVGFTNNEFRSYGSAIGDVDNDGKVDIAVMNNLDTTPNIWKNRSINSNNFLSIDLEGTVSNIDGVGAVIEISINGNKQYRNVMSSESYMSQNSFREIFGVGTASVIDYIKVTWPSGIVDTFTNVTTNQLITLVEGTSLSVDLFNDSVNVAYNNPIRDNLNIQSSHIINSYKLYDSLGHLVLGENYTGYNLTLNLLNVPSGLYFCDMLFEGGRSKVIKLIKE
ncbi:FG-GAP-like repeat-containing protein [Winogradskyella sp. PE311]|uniref:FG-GAP-like repeat-containing protein n=1 Tax=Winogradskyella sp. PE311 TaxID=3366943 RepID=UPI0039801597